MTVSKWIVGAIIVISLIALGFVLHLWIAKPVTITNTVTEYIKGDTVKVIEKHFFKVTEYVKAEVKDDTAKTTIYTEKIFDEDTLSAKTDIKYSIRDSTFNVDQSFNLVQVKKFVVDTVKIQVPTEKIIYKDTSLWEKPYVNFIFGVIVSVLIFFLSGG